MATTIMDSIEQWLAGRHPNTQHLITCDDPNVDLHALINTAYKHQNFIGWGHFLRGCLSLKWKTVLAYYYHGRQPGELHNPKLWMRKTINQLWKFILYYLELQKW